MASFDVVNFSLRPSKAIQRQIVFEGIREAILRLALDNPVYIGFGSIWFVDFIMAHKMLNIRDMVSMECDEIGYHRARFNKPYATVKILPHRSSDALPTLYKDKNFHNRPWVIWLDSDQKLTENMIEDIRSILERAPHDTIFIATFNGYENEYGKPRDRTNRLRELLGDVVPDDLATNQCKGKNFHKTLANLTIDFMESVATSSSRPGGFKKAFRFIYKDNAPMLTVGGILPSPENALQVNELTGSASWRCLMQEKIEAPILTIREAAALQSKLPAENRLNREDVNDLGFDLKEEHVESFQNYYREYPMYAQIVI